MFNRIIMRLKLFVSYLFGRQSLLIEWTSCLTELGQWLLPSLLAHFQRQKHILPPKLKPFCPWSTIVQFSKYSEFEFPTQTWSGQKSFNKQGFQKSKKKTVLERKIWNWAKLIDCEISEIENMRVVGAWRKSFLKSDKIEWNNISWVLTDDPPRKAGVHICVFCHHSLDQKQKRDSKPSHNRNRVFITWVPYCRGLVLFFGSSSWLLCHCIGISAALKK